MKSRQVMMAMFVLSLLCLYPVGSLASSVTKSREETYLHFKDCFDKKSFIPTLKQIPFEKPLHCTKVGERGYEYSETTTKLRSSAGGTRISTQGGGHTYRFLLRKDAKGNISWKRLSDNDSSDERRLFTAELRACRFTKESEPSLVAYSRLQIWEKSTISNRKPKSYDFKCMWACDLIQPAIEDSSDDSSEEELFE